MKKESDHLNYPSEGYPRKWIKLPIAIDARTQEIVGEISTDITIDDGKAFPDVILQVSRSVIVIGGGWTHSELLIGLSSKTTA